MKSASSQLSKLTLHNPPADVRGPTLKINVLSHQHVPQFSGRQTVGTFGIGDKLDLRTDLPPKVLIPEQNLQNILGQQLKCIESNIIWVEDNVKYKGLKQAYFLKFLKDHGFMKKVKEGTFQKPDFICLSNIFKTTLLSPYDGEVQRLNPNWTVYGMRWNDMIFLWSDESDERTGKKKAKARRSRLHGMAFLHLVTNVDPMAKIYNRDVQHFEVQKVKFGSHQLLSFHEKEAVDEKGDWVEIKVSRDGLKRYDTRLFCWAKQLAPGIQNYVVGTHDNGRVTAVKRMTFEKITQCVRSDLKGECLIFQDRLFSWIQVQLKGNDKGVIKEFYRDSDRVAVRDVSGMAVPFEIDF